MTKTLAVYITPPAEDPFYQFASELLGYDIWTQECQPHPRYAEWVGGASSFGFHCTIGDALVFQDTDELEIRARLSWICSRVQPFELENFHLDHTFWAGTRLLVSGLSEQSGQLQTLAGLISTTINPLYIDSPYYPKLLPLLSEYNKEYYSKFEAPQVLEHFMPHFTLASGIPNEDARGILVSFAQKQFFDDASDYTQTVDRVHLVNLKSDGFYKVIGTYMLGSGNAV